jgi:DNA-directed RNA polymerase specialized sigma24 family protein
LWTKEVGVAIEKPDPQNPAFQALLAWLNPDNERAADEYVRFHQRFTKMFEARGCLTPEDCADETFNRVGRQLAAGKEIRTNNPAVYLDGVARYVLREQWSKPAAEDIEAVPSEKLTQSDARELDDRQEQERRHTCLDECLQVLPAESRVLVLEYYAEDKTLKIDTRDRMASRLGIATAVLRNRIFKLRNNLRACVGACLAR